MTTIAAGSTSPARASTRGPARAGVDGSAVDNGNPPRASARGSVRTGADDAAAGARLRVLVVDDEPLARRRMRALLAAHRDVEVVAEAVDGDDAVRAVREHRPDLVFLDVQMPGCDGFEVIRRLGPTSTPSVIFVTAFDQYAIAAFEVNALDYLLKPFDESRLAAALARARGHLDRGPMVPEPARVVPDAAAEVASRLEALLAQVGDRKKYLDRITIRSNGKVFFVRTADIDWIQAEGNYAHLHVGKESHLIRETMQEMEQKLDPERFLRIHRSTLVNIDRIKEMHPWFSGDYAVILHDGTELRLSRGQREKLHGRLGELL